MTLRGSCEYRCFGGTYRLHHQGDDGGHNSETSVLTRTTRRRIPKTKPVHKSGRAAPVPQRRGWWLPEEWWEGEWLVGHQAVLHCANRTGDILPSVEPSDAFIPVRNKVNVDPCVILMCEVYEYFVSSGMLHRVALVRTDVSEELGAFIRVTSIGELGTLAVTNNRRTS
jgi:hypothetical protein